jgi:hypothetical protein
MSAATLLSQVERDGVTVVYRGPDSLSLSGPRAAVAKWSSAIREAKPLLIQHLLRVGDVGVVATAPSVISPTEPDPDDFAERAAHVQHDGGIQQPLADCLAAILTAGKPIDMPAVRWLRFQTDAAVLIDDWGTKALALGWSVNDLLGVDVIAPWQRIDCMGLCWLLNGAAVVAIDERKATIKGGSSIQTFSRRDF